MLLKAEKQPKTGNPIRQDRRQLPRLRPRRIHPPLDQALCPHRLDAWHLKPGMNMPQWMSNELDLADRCILICDEKYVQKADGQVGGVGWEYRLIQGDIFRNQTTANSRFIPVVTSQKITLPIALQDCLAVHCPRSDDTEKVDEPVQWAAVLDALRGGEMAPPVAHG